MIPGLTRIWAKRNANDQTYHWFSMPYAARGYDENEQLVDYYESEFPGQYFYQITADSNLCRPIA